jgi:pimeloyl-ACP methyl ester carboxylesterase
MLSHWFAPGATTSVKSAVDYSIEAFRRAVPASLATALRLISAFDGGRELARVPRPIRFAAAEEDQVVTPPDLRATARLPTGSFSLLRGCNHMVVLEHPERVADLLRSTLPI